MKKVNVELNWEDAKALSAIISALKETGTVTLRDIREENALQDKFRMIDRCNHALACAHSIIPVSPTASAGRGSPFDAVWVAGAEAAADIADQYNGVTLHDHRLGDCILGKLNIRKGKPRKNEFRPTPTRNQMKR